MIKYEASYAFTATLNPAHPEKEMKFSLYKRKSGDWTKVDSRSFAQTSEENGKGVYSTGSAFEKLNASRCKVIAKFAGDDDHAASKGAKKFDC
jgi:hypothetical protein